MELPKQKCIQCTQEKPIDEFFIYKKSGKPYSWCKNCVRHSSQISQENHLAKAQEFRQRWGAHAI